MNYIPFDENFIERFWKKVKKVGPDDCWLWQASSTNTGYGQVTQHISGGWGKPRKTKGWGAHQVSFILANGYKPETTCHSCDVKACVNPKHLWAGTPKKNGEDFAKKGLSRYGQKSATAKYSDEQIREVKRLFNAGMRRIDISKKMNIHYQTILDVVSGRRWQRVV